jgi:hypothetical protein
MNKKLKAKWIADLRANPGKQGRGALQTASGRYCCLGRLALLAGVPHFFDRVQKRWFFDFPREKLQCILPANFCGLNDSQVKECWLRNDGDGDHPPQSFFEIADWIEENIPVED